MNINSNIHYGNSKLITADNLDYHMGKSYLLTTSTESLKYIKIFEYQLRQYEHLGTTWLLQSVRGGHNSIVIDINIRCENVDNPTITVLSDKYNSLNKLFDIYYKKTFNNVIEFYIGVNTSYLSLYIKKVYSNKIVNVNYNEFKELAILSGVEKVTKKNKYEVSTISAEISNINNKTTIINKSKYFDKLISIRLIVTVTETVPVYGTICLLGNENTVVSNDVYIKIINTTTEKIGLIKPNSNGLLIQLGNNTLEAGNYQINTTIPLD